MVEKKTPAQEIRDLGNLLAQINGLDNVEIPEQQPDNDTLVLASNPYGSSYEDLLAAKEK
jgi:hypothetical protein